MLKQLRSHDSHTVGDNPNECIPFLSEYSDCSEENQCSGCNRCTCNEDGEWECKAVFSCPVDDSEDTRDEDTVTVALDVMYNELRDRERKKKQNRPLVPPPPNHEHDLIVPEKNSKEEDFKNYFWRQKRSLMDGSEDNKNNHTITFFHTTDDLNEDTLKNSNKSGTIEVAKVDTNVIPKISRRTDLLDHFNNSAVSSLHIEYNQPQEYDHHIAENKIDAVSNARNTAGQIRKNELQKLIGNYSQNKRDKELSKLVVNELKTGREIIGNHNVPPVSNITFTPENDTLTAMAFIAGNLLSKLWDMEKDVSDNSIETEVLKHEKINDLIDLFKEPLSIRQETFLKNALEKLSDSLNKNKMIKNVSICETITESDFPKNDDETSTGNNFGKMKIDNKTCKQNSEKMTLENEKKFNISADAVSKLNSVLSLTKKFERTLSNIKDIKQQSKPGLSNNKTLSIDDTSSLHLFGSLLDKITKLLIPSKSHKNKLTNQLKNLNQFKNNNNLNKILQQKLNINFGKFNITTKDKLILDYLNHIESNPNCLLNSQIRNLNTNIKGNIISSLSDFLKTESYVDLINLTNSDIRNNKRNMNKTSTEIPNETTTSKKYLRNDIYEEKEDNEINSIKQKLKIHLKALIDDILEIKKEQGMNINKSINIGDALPCIYKILNVDKKMYTLNDGRVPNEQEHASNITSLAKLKTIIDTLKIELATGLPTRRSNSIVSEKSKSVKMWERIIKNINGLRKKTRRNFDMPKSKNYDELKSIMENAESMGNTYKNFAILSVLQPQKRLMLLKTLEADAKQHKSALENIKNSLDTVNRLSLDKRNDIEEFIDNSISNMRLSMKVLEKLKMSQQDEYKNSQVEVIPLTKYKSQNRQKFEKPYSLTIKNEKERKLKISRDQILTQLIMNRIRSYLQFKEGNGLDHRDDINYNIGKRILVYIQNGNLNIAKELFKIFLANSRNEENKNKLEVKDKSRDVSHSRKRGPLLVALKEPLLRFDGPEKNLETKTDDYILEQLSKFKNSRDK